MPGTTLHDLTLRVETPLHMEAVREVNRRAFGHDNEADLVDRLRENAKFRLSLVALVDDQVVGHILFTDMTGVTQRLAGLGPLAVLPEYQRRGIGSALVRAGLEYLREQSCDAVVVLGHRDYYARFGFRPAADVGITTQFDVPPEYLFVVALSDVAVAPGKAIYQPEFEQVEA